MHRSTGQAPRAGYSLPREYYTDPAIFEQDLERILLRHWFCAGHVSSVPNSGDYFLVELGNESVIVCRAADGEVHALLNVCRHRGSRVCVTRSGTATGGGFTCPYHAWSYALASAPATSSSEGGAAAKLMKMRPSSTRNCSDFNAASSRLKSGGISRAARRRPSSAEDQAW